MYTEGSVVSKTNPNRLNAGTLRPLNPPVIFSALNRMCWPMNTNANDAMAR